MSQRVRVGLIGSQFIISIHAEALRACPTSEEAWNYGFHGEMAVSSLRTNRLSGTLAHAAASPAEKNSYAHRGGTGAVALAMVMHRAGNNHSLAAPG